MRLLQHDVRLLRLCHEQTACLGHRRWGLCIVTSPMQGNCHALDSEQQGRGRHRLQLCGVQDLHSPLIRVISYIVRGCKAPDVHCWRRPFTDAMALLAEECHVFARHVDWSPRGLHGCPAPDLPLLEVVPKPGLHGPQKLLSRGLLWKHLLLRAACVERNGHSRSLSFISPPSPALPLLLAVPSLAPASLPASPCPHSSLPAINLPPLPHLSSVLRLSVPFPASCHE